MDIKTHWSTVYQTKAPNQVSWYQEYPALSLQFIEQTGIDHDAPIIDVGAGASTLVDHLVQIGYQNLSLLDLSGEALQEAQARLGTAAAALNWIEGDVTQVELPKHHYALWHDRAVFHFLTDPIARARYVEQVRQTVRPGGHVIVATFAPDGPEQCSGLKVARYDAASLHGVFGSPFEFVRSTNESHQTPWGSEQRFVYCYCRVQDRR